MIYKLGSVRVLMHFNFLIIFFFAMNFFYLAIFMHFLTEIPFGIVDLTIIPSYNYTLGIY